MKNLQIGIDLGGTFIKGGLITDSGDMIAKGELPTQVEKGVETIAKNIALLCDNLITQAGVSKSEINGIGIGSPGLIDSAQGIVIFAGNMGFNNFPLAKWQ